MEKAIGDYSDKLCTKCNTVEKKAKVFFQDCKHFLCESCLDAHKAWDGLKHHKVLMVEDLTSGKVILSDLDQQDQNCAEHDGEQKRFYCETCDKPVCRDCIVLKQCCRDHDTVPIKQALEKHVSQLKESVQTCREKKEECQDAFEKIKQIEEDLSSSAIKVQETLDIKKRLYLQAIEGIYNTYKCDTNDLCKERKAKITEDTDNLKTVMNQIDSTLKLGVNLTESGSPYDIVSNYRSVLSRIQKVNDIEVNKVDKTLAYIPTPVVGCVLGKQWERNGELVVPCQSMFMCIEGIAATSDGNIAVCDSLNNVHVHSRSGEFKHVFKSSHVDGYGGDVAITPSNAYVITTKSKRCKLYNSQYKLISQFKTCNADNEPSGAVSVTVDKDGYIILAMEDTISIHNTDGSVISRFAIPYEPMSVAVTSKQEIVVASLSNNTLQLLDYTGKSILTFDPPPDVNIWSPCYVCCSKRDEVFVGNCNLGDSIYQYTAGGVYMGCIATQVTNISCTALSHDDKELFAASLTSCVEIFRRPLY